LGRIGFIEDLIKFLYFTPIENWVPWTFWLVLCLIVFQTVQFLLIIKLLRTSPKKAIQPKITEFNVYNKPKEKKGLFGKKKKKEDTPKPILPDEVEVFS